MRRILAGVSCVASVACALSGAFKQEMDGWVERPFAGVVQTYGPPERSVVLPDSSTVYSWTELGKTVAVPAGYTTIIKQHQCQFSVTVAKTGMVSNWQARGDRCRR